MFVPSLCQTNVLQPSHTRTIARKVTEMAPSKNPSNTNTAAFPETPTSHKQPRTRQPEKLFWLHLCSNWTVHNSWYSLLLRDSTRLCHTAPDSTKHCPDTCWSALLHQASPAPRKERSRDSSPLILANLVNLRVVKFLLQLVESPGHFRY